MRKQCFLKAKTARTGRRGESFVDDCRSSSKDCARSPAWVFQFHFPAFLLSLLTKILNKEIRNQGINDNPSRTKISSQFLSRFGCKQCVIHYHFCMPEVFREQGYRFFFFSREGNEPRHVHIEKAENYAKFPLDPIELAESCGFSEAK